MENTTNEQPDEQFETLMKAFQAATERGDHKEADRIALESLLFAGEHAPEPEADQRLRQEAVGHMERAEWDQAVAKYREALHRTAPNSAARYKTHDELSYLYSLLDRNEDALDQAQQALAVATTLDLLPLITVASATLGGTLLAMDDPSGALRAANDIVDRCQDNPMHDLERARGHVLRARCSVRLGDLQAAETDLATAWRLLEPRIDSTFMVGFQSGLANWWEVTGQLRTTPNDLPGAATAYGKAVDFRRTVANAPQLSGPGRFAALANALRRHGTVLLAIGDTEGGTAAVQESASILRQIGLPAIL